VQVQADDVADLGFQLRVGKRFSADVLLLVLGRRDVAEALVEVGVSYQPMYSTTASSS
jgi:hypothetical protein